MCMLSDETQRLRERLVTLGETVDQGVQMEMRCQLTGPRLRE